MILLAFYLVQIRLAGPSKLFLVYVCVRVRVCIVCVYCVHVRIIMYVHVHELYEHCSVCST